jgi:hypothetical protein
LHILVGITVYLVLELLQYLYVHAGMTKIMADGSTGITAVKMADMKTRMRAVA